MKPTLFFILVALGSTAAHAQTVAPLSSDNAATHLVRAAGMSLRDGDLPPGTLTVRVVRGGFTGNVSGQQVSVQIIGGAIESAVTGTDGRAQFPHLPVGAKVQAWTELGGERLMSDVFDIPNEAGVRLLLVSGGDATASGPAPGLGGIGPASFGQVVPAAVTATVTDGPAGPGTSTAIVVIRMLLAVTSIVCFGMFLFAKRYRLVRRTGATGAVTATE